MDKKTISKNISPIDFTRREKTLVLAALCFLSISIGHTQTAWVDQKFTDYTPGETLNTTLSPTLITNIGFPTLYTTITNDSGNNMARYQKTTNQTTGSQVMFAFSPTNEMTARVSGYVSFKIKQNLNPTIATNYSLDVGIGDNVISNNTSSNAKRFIGVSFFQSTSSNNIQIKSGATTITNTSYTNSTTYPKVQIWFNDSDSTTMAYTDPSGASQNLSANTFVVYLGTTLLTPSASGTALTGASATSLNIGKVGFSAGSANAIDFNFDDVYAAGSAPAVASIPITSPTTASAMNQYPFSFAVLADGATSYSATGLPNGLSIHPTTGVISGAPNVSNVTAVFNATINVSGPGGITGTGRLAITVNPYPTSAPVITPSTATASGNAAVAFSYQIIASNTPRSYAIATGTLPAGLTLNTYTGLISGIPTTITPDGGTTVTLTAENPSGASSERTLTISIGIAPPNIFTGSNASLNNAPSWSLGSSPTSSSNPGSYTDLVFSSSAFPLTTSSGNVFGQSWNVTNGATYTFSSVNSAQTTFKIGNNNPNVTTFYNSVAASDNVLVYLTNGSSLTFSPSNTTVGAPESLVSLYNSGSLEIGTNSVLNIKASLIEGGTGSRSITKKGAGTLILGTNNTYRGGTTLEAGTLSVNNSEGLGTGAMTLAGGTLTNTVDLDLSHIILVPTTSGSITFDKLSGSTTTINGATTLNVASNTTVSTYTLAGNSDTNNLVTKKGLGTLWLRGGGAPTVMGGWRVEAGTLYVSTTSSSGTGTGTVTMAGGDLKFSKGVGSSGTYSGHGQDTQLEVLANTTITLDPNPLTLANNNTVSFTNLIAGQQTIRVVKGDSTKSSATEVGYTDPSITFSQASLNGANGLATTFDVATNVVVKLQAATGSGGVTKTGSGTLTLADNNSLYAAKATATLAGEMVTSIAVTYPGNSSNLYTTAPVVTIAAPASGTAATARAILTDGLVTSVELLNGGSGYTSAPSVTIAAPGGATPNSYTGPTTISQGTLALSGSLSSRLAFSTASVLETALVSSNSPTTTGAIAFASGANGAKVRPVGDPTLPSYTLVTAAGGITGTPTLETPITGYSLVIEGNSLKLKQTSTSDTTPPVITVVGANPVTVAQGSVYSDAGATTDDGSAVTANIPANITSTVGSKTVTYDSVDASGNNATQKTRTVIVTDQTAPVLVLNGANPLSVTWGGAFTDLGASFTDNVDGSKTVYSLDTVDTSKVGSTTLTYSAVDAGGNAAVNVTRTVTVTLANNGTTVGADGLSDLMRYALGGTNPSSKVELPTVAVTSTTLTMNALIRINDPKVSVVGIYGLTPGTWVTGSPITGVPSSSQSGAVAGVTQRQDFSVPRGTDSKKFMYLKATQNP